nr:sperm-associated antigen 7 [Pogona vitticeps]
MAELDLLGSILSSMEPPPGLGDREARRAKRDLSLAVVFSSFRHDVVEVAGLTSFSFGDEEDSRYVMIFKKEFAPSDEELEAYRRGEEWDPQQAEEKRRLKELAQKQAEEEALKGPTVVNPNTDYKDKYSHLIGKVAAKDAAHAMEANKAYGCVPVANKRDTRSIEEAMNEIRAKKRLRQSEDESAVLSSSSS